MNIGNNIGKRAKANENLGYFFETINLLGYHLFVYDEKFGHNAPLYFEQHPNDWSDELTGRCWIVDLDDITLVGHNNVKKVIL